MTAATRRTATLKHDLLDRRHETQNAVEARIRASRASRRPDVGDTVDDSDTDARNGMEFILLQMQALTLVGIDAALLRLDSGQYGICFDCGKTIAAPRLHAQPFAVRCHACQDRREAHEWNAGAVALPDERKTPSSGIHLS